MDNRILGEYLHKIERMADRDYLLAILAYHAAPTIEGIKAASVITFTRDRRNLCLLWEKYKGSFLYYYKLDYKELKKDNRKTVILLYQRKLLLNVISNYENRQYLGGVGYSSQMTLEEILDLLTKRYEYSFPHEIGIFLGFPLKDVKEFIRYPEKKPLLYGYWKVFSDVEQAKFKFDLYDRAKLKIMKDVLRESNLS